MDNKKEEAALELVNVDPNVFTLETAKTVYNTIKTLLLIVWLNHYILMPTLYIVRINLRKRSQYSYKQTL